MVVGYNQHPPLAMHVQRACHSYICSAVACVIRNTKYWNTMAHNTAAASCRNDHKWAGAYVKKNHK